MISLLKHSLILIILLSLEACAMGSKSAPRKLQDKMFHLCQDYETEQPIGKVCNNTCIKREFGKCKQWDRKVMDLRSKEDFEFFRSGAFILIDEDQLK